MCFYSVFLLACIVDKETKLMGEIEALNNVQEEHSRKRIKKFVYNKLIEGEYIVKRKFVEDEMEIDTPNS